MAFDASQFMYSSGSAAYTITNSVRFDEARTCSLALTPGTAGDRQTFTFSTWVKFNFAGNDNGILHAREDANDRFFFGQTSNYLFITYYVGGTEKNIRTNALYRDPSNWYHVVLRVDTTTGTANDRIRIYVNGVLQTLHTGQMPTQNDNLAVSDTVAHKIGQRVSNNDYKADYYLAETVFIDGQTLAPTSFGETDDDYGHWKPIDVSSLTFGDEGYYLNYAASGVGTASSSTIGADVSGNTNHWTSAGLVTTDQMLDSPTNNVTTLNPLSSLGATEYSEGNLKFKVTSSGDETSFGTIGTSSGKWYFEVFANTISNAYIDIGVGSVNHPDIATPQSHMEMTGYYCLQLADNYIKRFDNGAEVDSTSVSNDTGDIIMIAYDVDNNKFWAGKDGTWLNSGNPAGGANAWITMDDGFTTLAPAVCTKENDILTTNFGQDSSFAGAATAQGETDGNGIGDFYYEPPSGFLALCTKNLPEPAIVPTDYFNTVLYTGNGSTQDITSVGFSPNLTWIKNRAATDANQIFDSVRGVTKTLDSGSTAAEAVNDDTLTHFLSNGFTTGDDVVTNTDGEAYVAWNWKAGTSVSGNSTGAGDDVAYTGSVNTDAGISIIKYGGNGSTGHQIPHRLGVVPDMIWIKNITTQSWNCFFPNTSMGATKGLQLDNGGAQGTVSHLNNTMPTSTVVELELGAATNTRDGNNDPQPYIMYSFKSIPGYSKMNMYGGNGSADGSFVFCGFRPSFVLMKVTGLDDERWMMYDSKRDPVNFVSKRLLADDNNAESSGSGQSLDFLSNGFKIRANQASINSAGYFYVYMAFAETPFKYSNAR